MPIVLIIDEKITLEQLMQGKKVEVIYETSFNNKTQIKIFPDDYIPEEQYIFKKVYDDAVYGSEVGSKIHKLVSIGNNIQITVKTRLGTLENDLALVDTSHMINMKFTRHGFTKEDVTISVPYGDNFSQSDIDLLSTLGIIVEGVSNNFNVLQQRGDLTIEVIKEPNDSFISLPDFDNGKILLLDQ